MRSYKINWGSLLFFRWLIASWCLQGVHVLDCYERNLRVIFELITIIFIYLGLLLIIKLEFIDLVLVFFVIHSSFWLLDSHWLVGYREVNRKFRNKGISSIINYLEVVNETLSNEKSVIFIGVYGSLCRKKYHDRSDLDLRIIQKKPFSIRLFLKVQKLRYIGIWGYKIPLDLKLVDSLPYLINEMRADEHPIIIYNNGIEYYDHAIDFTTLKMFPQNFMKDNIK